jgi:hypothetical protein
MALAPRIVSITGGISRTPGSKGKRTRRTGLARTGFNTEKQKGGRVEMSSTRRPWYPWYPKDFNSDEKVQALSPLAELLYRRALDVAWQANGCLLLNVCQKLANQIGKGLTEKEFENAWAEIQFSGFELFKTTKDGKWLYSERLRREAEKIENIQKTRSEFGKKGAQAKAKASAKAKAKQKPKQSASHTYSYTDKEKKKEIYKEKSREPKKFNPPTEGEVQKYFTSNGYTAEAAKRFFEYYNAGNWHDQTGRAVKNWKQKAIAVWFKSEDANGQRRNGENGTHRHKSRVDRNNAALKECLDELGYTGKPEDDPDNGCIDVVGGTPKTRLVE